MEVPYGDGNGEGGRSEIPGLRRGQSLVAELLAVDEQITATDGGDKELLFGVREAGTNG
ncbi:UNVERIFIED_ORG: hypothetical protein FHR35_009120 [Microbispora rosea subsp. rosea]